MMTTTLIDRLYRSVGLSARTEVREAASLIGSERPLIIVGPAGLDHEAIAREAHASSSRRRYPFVVVDTSQAQARRTLARAGGGTVYVDLTDVDLDGRFASALVGWDGSSVDVRPIFSSHDLERLRAGLGALADGPCVRLRPLSERTGDVPHLLAQLLGEAGHKASLAALSTARRRGLTRARAKKPGQPA